MIIDNKSISNTISNNILDGINGMFFGIYMLDQTTGTASTGNSFINNYINYSSGASIGTAVYVGINNDENRFIGNTISCNVDVTHGCLELVDSGLNVIAYNKIYTPNYKAIGHLYSGSYNNLYTDNELGDDSLYFLEGFTDNLKNNTLLNNTYNHTIYRAGSFGNNELSSGWYLKVIVKDINGTAIPNAVIEIYNTTGSLEYNGLTGASGYRNFNITEFDWINGVYIYHSLYNISVNKLGFSNSTIFNATTNGEIELVLGYSSMAGNSLPILYEPETSQCLACVKPDVPLRINIIASDPEMDTIYYSYICNLTASPSPFDTNSTKICIYPEGEYTLELYANDSFHGEDYISINRSVIVTNDECICTEDGMTFSVKLVDKDNIEKGTLPTIYFGIVGFMENILGSVLILAIIFFAVLIIGGIASVIMKLATLRT
jgi:hypothetical protein